MENITMFVIGTVIFSLYLLGYLTMVNRQNMIQKKESENRNIDIKKVDVIDMDGYGNWSRFPKTVKKRKPNKIKRL